MVVLHKNLQKNTKSQFCEIHFIQLFSALKKYKEEFGDCNVKQNLGPEDNKSSNEMVRKLSTWVGKNRKDMKLRGRSSTCVYATNVTASYRASERISDGKATNEYSGLEVATPFCPNNAETAQVITPGDIIIQNHRDDPAGDDSSVFDDAEADSIHADPYKRIALDSLGFDWDPRNSRWNNMYEELRRYKEEHGAYLMAVVHKAHM